MGTLRIRSRKEWKQTKRNYLASFSEHGLNGPEQNKKAQEFFKDFHPQRPPHLRTNHFRGADLVEYWRMLVTRATSNNPRYSEYLYQQRRKYLIEEMRARYIYS